MNILIIEDEIFLARRIGIIFSEKILSNRVDIVNSYWEFETKLHLVPSYDIIITDLNLGTSEQGELDGYRVIRAIRAIHKRVPIIVISGLNDIERLREAFEYGANDYICKPFRLKELELRILNWFKIYYFLNTENTGTSYFYGKLRYDTLKNEFYLEDTIIPLTKKNKYLLSLFFISPEKLIREDYLNEKIWGDICTEIERNLRVSIYRLKQALSPYGLDHWIQNIRGEGYIFSQRSR